MTQAPRRIITYMSLASFIASIIIYKVLAVNEIAIFTDIKAAEVYALISLSLLFIILFAGPLYRIFPNAPYRLPYFQSFGALGISCFYFALLHSSVGFFALLQGFKGIPFLGTVHALAVLFGFIALLILSVLAATSFQFVKNLVGKYWKPIHRFVYVVGLLIVAHILLIGTHFRDFTQPVAIIFILLFVFLLILHAINIKTLLSKKYEQVSPRIFTAGLALLLIGILSALYKLHELIVGAHH